MGPVDPTSCDAVADEPHTARGTLADVGYAAYGNNILHITITVDLGRVVTVEDTRRVFADLGGEDAPVLVRGLSRGAA
mgnify:CR=1 FL=1